MTLYYYCRHCGHSLGMIEDEQDQLYQLVQKTLTAEEQEEIVEKDPVNGGILIKTICEDCQDALNQSPQYHSLDFLIQ